MQMKFSQPEISTTDSDPFDPRMGDILGSKLVDDKEARLVIIGFPCDIGVTRNNGRSGASGGPDAIRRILYRMTPDAQNHKPFNILLQHTLDMGNLEIQSELEQDQINLGKAIEPFLSEGIPVLILGGGHETSYGHFLGYSGAGKSIRILNWDAHADVRELKDGKGHSGSPFRQVLDHPSRICGGYTVAGLQPHSVSISHLDWMEKRRAGYYFANQIDQKFIRDAYGSMDQDHFVTFDLDAVDQKEAPGVSAPAVSGMDAIVWLYAVYEAGRCKKVTSIDIVELNPVYDFDHKTARLAAKTVWMFMKGLAERNT